MCLPKSGLTRTVQQPTSMSGEPEQHQAEHNTTDRRIRLRGALRSGPPRPGDLLALLRPSRAAEPAQRTYLSAVYDTAVQSYKQVTASSVNLSNFSASDFGSSDVEPRTAYGVCLEDGQWAYFLQTSHEHPATVVVTALPSNWKELAVVRQAAPEDVANIMNRVFHSPVGYKILDAAEQQDSGAWAPETSSGNASWAFYATSVAGTHIRVPLSGTPFWHHSADTGEGTAIHYSRGQVRLDPLYCLMGQDGTGPIILVDRAVDVEEAILRAVERMGESQYNLTHNNCEHFASYAVNNGLPRSKQVEEAGLSVGIISGSLALITAGVWPALALIALGIGGTGVGTALVANIQARVQQRIEQDQQKKRTEQKVEA